MTRIILILSLLLGLVSCSNKTSKKTDAAPASTAQAKPVEQLAPAAPRVKLLEADAVWNALDKEKYDHEALLREYSPEWVQIQAEIDQTTADIKDPSLRQSERSRVAGQLLPEAKQQKLHEDALNKLKARQEAYLQGHKEDFRFYFAFPTNIYGGFPKPVMELSTLVEGSETLFHEPAFNADANTNSYPRHYLQFTVREMDAILTNFRSLKLREIAEDAKSREPISAVLAASTGSQAAADYGLIPNTPDQVQRVFEQLKVSNREEAEKTIWHHDVVVVGQVDYPTSEGVIRKNSPIYLVDRNTGTIIGDVPSSAFCFEKADKWVSVPACSVSQTANCSEYGGSEEVKDNRCQEPRQTQPIP